MIIRFHCNIPGHATCLVILAEEEVVFIDLESEDWPPLAAPYLASLHSSAITCSLLASDVASDVYSKIKVCVFLFPLVCCSPYIGTL